MSSPRSTRQQHRRAHDDRANPKSPTRTCAEAIEGARAIGGLSMEHPPIQTYYRHTISYWYIYIYIYIQYDSEFNHIDVSICMCIYMYIYI